MAATITSFQKIGTKVWRVDYTGTSPFRRYINGVLVGNMSSTETFIIIMGDSDVEPPPIEVIDSTENEEDVNQVKYPQRAVLQWRVASNAAYYTIQQLVNSEWTDIRTIHQHRTSTYMKFKSDQLADVTTHQFRIIPHTASGDAGEPLPMDVLIVRNPPPVDVTISLVGGTLTVAAV